MISSELKTFYRIYTDTRNENTAKIVAKQNDTKTRYLDITVTDNGVPVDLTGCEVRIYGRKKDGTEFYNDGTLQDAKKGRCLFEATTQMLAYAGQNVNCEIVVFKDNEQILSTMPFDIFVVKSLMGENAIESSNEYGALVVLFQNLYEAHDLMTTMVQHIGTPSEIAAQYNLATMWQAWEFLTDYMKTDLTQMIEQALANASVQGVLDKIGSAEDSDTAGTVMAKGNAILNMLANGGARLIKSIQFQKISKSSATIVFTISEVNPEKTFVIIDGYAYQGSSGYLAYYLESKTETQITIKGQVNGSNSAIHSIQVIEFY